MKKEKKIFIMITPAYRGHFGDAISYLEGFYQELISVKRVNCTDLNFLKEHFKSDLENIKKQSPERAQKIFEDAFCGDYIFIEMKIKCNMDYIYTGINYTRIHLHQGIFDYQWIMAVDATTIQNWIKHGKLKWKKGWFISPFFIIFTYTSPINVSPLSLPLLLPF